jgi:hypothetical protein
MSNLSLKIIDQNAQKCFTERKITASATKGYQARIHSCAKLPEELIKNPKANRQHFLIYGIVEHMQKNKLLCYKSNAGFAKELGINERNFRKYAHDIIDWELLDRRFTGEDQTIWTIRSPKVASINSVLVPFELLYDTKLKAQDILFINKIEQYHYNPKSGPVDATFSCSDFAREYNISARSAQRTAQKLQSLGRIFFSEGVWFSSRIAEKACVTLSPPLCVTLYPPRSDLGYIGFKDLKATASRKNVVFRNYKKKEIALAECVANNEHNIDKVNIKKWLSNGKLHTKGFWRKMCTELAALRARNLCANNAFEVMLRKGWNMIINNKFKGPVTTIISTQTIVLQKDYDDEIPEHLMEILVNEL